MEETARKPSAFNSVIRERTVLGDLEKMKNAGRPVAIVYPMNVKVDSPPRVQARMRETAGPFRAFSSERNSRAGYEHRRRPQVLERDVDRRWSHGPSLKDPLALLRRVLSPALLDGFMADTNLQKGLLKFFASHLIVTADGVVRFDYEKMSRCCGFYYENMSSEGAKRHLRNLPKGSFVLRTSSEPSIYLYSLSVKTVKGVTSVRLPRVSISPERNINNYHVYDNHNFIDCNGDSERHSLLPKSAFPELLVVSSRPEVGLRLDCNDFNSKRVPVYVSVFHLVESLRQTTSPSSSRRHGDRKPIAGNGDHSNGSDRLADFDADSPRVYLQFNDQPLLALQLGSPVIGRVFPLQKLALCAFVLRRDASDLLLGLDRCCSNYTISQLRQ